jgi:hypothetical protein
LSPDSITPFDSVEEVVSQPEHYDKKSREDFHVIGGLTPDYFFHQF